MSGACPSPKHLKGGILGGKKINTKKKLGMKAAGWKTDSFVRRVDKLSRLSNLSLRERGHNLILLSGKGPEGDKCPKTP